MQDVTLRDKGNINLIKISAKKSYKSLIANA